MEGRRGGIFEFCVFGRTVCRDRTYQRKLVARFVAYVSIMIPALRDLDRLRLAFA